MLIVDTHVHVGVNWYEPVEVLLFQMEQNGVEKAILVQYRGNYDNVYELECVDRYPRRFGAVVCVDTEREDALRRLEEWVARGATGVRLSPGERSPGPDGLAIWRKAIDLGLVVSCLGRMEEFATEGFRDLVTELRGLTIVLEHLGGVKPEPEMNFELYEEALALADYPNVCIKVPGFGELLPRPSVFGEEPFCGTPRALVMAYEAFGATRMMWGSDYPPSGQREGYRNALRFPLQGMQFLREGEREWVFGKTAMSVWGFR